MMNAPLVTVITVSYNADKDIEETIKSVICHKSFEIEYLIIDGNSTDSTMVIINKYLNFIDLVISEQDNGIYDAMNKGVKRAKGKFITFINAGDILFKIPLDVLKKSYSDIICFPVLLSTGNVIKPKLNGWLRLRNTIPHQGCYYKNDNWLIFNLQFKVFADFELNQRLYKNNFNFEINDQYIVARHNLDGISNHRSSLNEIFEVVKFNYGPLTMILSKLYFKFYGARKRFKKLFSLK